MKIDELTATGKSIVLGIFATKTYKILQFRNQFCGWEDFYYWSNVIDNSNEPKCSTSEVIQKVLNAATIADKIVFVLDKITFPIKEGCPSYTCNELLLICRNDEFYNKTIFVKGENVINFDRNILLETTNL